MKKTIKLTFLFLSVVLAANSQTAIKAQGDKAYKKKDYIKAIEEYKILLENDKLKEDQLLKLANSYYYIRDYKKASENYITYIHEGNSLSLAEYNKYLQSLNMGGYSDVVLTDAINTRLYLFSEKVVHRYEHLKESERKVKPFSRTITSYKFNNLEINSENSDFGLTIFDDSTFMYSSSKENKAYNNVYKRINQPFINIYKAKLSESGIDTAYADVKYIDRPMMHNSSPYYDKLYNRLYYTQSVRKKNKLDFNNSKNNFRIVYGFLNDEKVVEKEYYYPEKITNYSYGHPFFDKEANRLYFVSDMPGGFGGTDIYYVEMNVEGVISLPVNLGNKVNSFADEMFPSVVDSQLYFSSDLFIGNGGLDIYKSTINKDQFDYPEHLDEPFNSKGDDFSYQVVKSNQNESTGFLSSNRDGGKGDDDIYSFIELKTIKKIKILGYAMQKGDNSIVLPNATVKISDTQGKEIKNIVTDDQGMFDVLLPIDSDYNFEISKEGYVATSGVIYLGDIDNINPISKKYYLEKEVVEDIYGNLKINLEPVYFEYDKADITPIAEEQLKFAMDFLIKYPETKFKLEAHTDARGSKGYNLRLSDKRVKSVNKYLLSQGITSDRIISAKGYGETKLINDCKDGIKCTDEQHELNRRTDFIIVEEVKK